VPERGQAHGARPHVCVHCAAGCAPAEAVGFGGAGCDGGSSAGQCCGLAANAAAAVYYHKAAKAASAASAAYAANNTEDGEKFLFSLSQQEVQHGGSIASVQSFCEVAVLLLIVVAFAVVGALSARRVSARLLGVDAASAVAATGRALRRRMLGTTAFVFVTFVVRAAFSTIYAVANQWRDVNRVCPDGTFGPCSSCRNVYAHMLNWMSYTPEFQVLIVLVSSPVALLVALWGMTSNATLQLMKSSQRQALLSLKPLPVKSVLQKMRTAEEEVRRCLFRPPQAPCARSLSLAHRNKPQRSSRGESFSPAKALRLAPRCCSGGATPSLRARWSPEPPCGSAKRRPPNRARALELHRSNGSGRPWPTARTR
jgi:hypothetical protein